jgi:hypothetical protein
MILEGRNSRDARVCVRILDTDRLAILPPLAERRAQSPPCPASWFAASERVHHPRDLDCFCCNPFLLRPAEQGAEPGVVWPSSAPAVRRGRNSAERATGHPSLTRSPWAPLAADVTARRESCSAHRQTGCPPEYGFAQGSSRE